MNQDITLYTYALSPYASKAQAFLNFKQLPFQVRYVHPLKVRSELDFTGQHFIPVVKVGNDWRADSTPIGLWLDECFPEAPRLVPVHSVERDQVLAIDHWVSDSLIAGNFRALIQGPAAQRRHNFWRLAKILDITVDGGLARPWQWLWPWLAPRAPFIRDLVTTLDQAEPVDAMQHRHCREFVDHLNGAPFLGGRQQASMADLSAYPQIINHYRCGCQGLQTFLQYPPIISWLKRMQACADSPIALLPAQCVVNELSS